MKLISIVQARDALAKLTETQFTSYKILRELVRLKKRADEEFEFYSMQERKAVTPMQTNRQTDSLFSLTAAGSSSRI